MSEGQLQWELAIVWRDTTKGLDDLSSYQLTGLPEHEVCRLFGIKGHHVPGYPIPVHPNELHLLQSYAASPLSMPPGTTGELWPLTDEGDDGEAIPEEGFSRTFWALLGYVIIGGSLGTWLWHLGHTTHKRWSRVLLQGGGGACLGLAAWCALWLFFLGGMALLARRTRLDD